MRLCGVWFVNMCLSFIYLCKCKKHYFSRTRWIWIHGWMYVCTFVCMYRWMEVYMHVWMKKWMYGRMDGRMSSRYWMGKTVRCYDQSITHHRFPAQKHFGLADVWPSPLRIILCFWKELNMTAAHWGDIQRLGVNSDSEHPICNFRQFLLTN